MNIATDNTTNRSLSTDASNLSRLDELAYAARTKANAAQEKLAAARTELAKAESAFAETESAPALKTMTAARERADGAVVLVRVTGENADRAEADRDRERSRLHSEHMRALATKASREGFLATIAPQLACIREARALIVEAVATIKNVALVEQRSAALTSGQGQLALADDAARFLVQTLLHAERVKDLPPNQNQSGHFDEVHRWISANDSAQF